MPAITVALLFRSILAFKAFDEVYLLTGGGPGTSSEIVSLHLYRVFFEQNQLGYGALLSVLTIVGVLMLLGAGRRLVAGARSAMSAPGAARARRSMADDGARRADARPAASARVASDGR